ncbi:LysR substrate-binding domain-containing protein [Pseudomonas syringae]|uniref:LysR substrate-binding domain-containing protein n=1 Tax=Pseudomonas syringae TaxID=317 RepID=UPI00200B819C|nr:LysR substrate-binding domain-containing protein [Pseudomonas syringae]MCK9733829.1 LysR substrate-binding domain-containing protein [Pseudomonas syringae pv. syringae]
MFELSQLRCFTTVATELNFRRAAERLNMTQPPLSRQIQILEHNLGVELFTRSTRSVALTAVYEFLPRVIAEARLKQPQVKISLTEMNTYQQHEALRARRIDLGIVRAPLFQPGYESECLVREPFVLAVPSNHRLAHADSVAVADLDGAPFLMYSHSAYPPFNELLTGMFRSARVAPEYVQWLGSSLTILALVNAGMGLALVPRCATNVVFKDVVFRDIDLGEGVQSELHLVWRTDNDNPACRMLLEAIRAAVRADEN